MEFRNATATVVLLECNLLDQCLEEITRKLHINWLNRPFSRCLNCNTLLVVANEEHCRQLAESMKTTVLNITIAQFVINCSGKVVTCDECDIN